MIFTKVGDFPVDSLIDQPPLDPGLVGVLDYVELRFLAVIFVSILVTWVVLCAETLYLWSWPGESHVPHVRCVRCVRWLGLCLVSCFLANSCVVATQKGIMWNGLIVAKPSHFFCRNWNHRPAVSILSFFIWHGMGLALGWNMSHLGRHPAKKCIALVMCFPGSPRLPRLKCVFGASETTIRIGPWEFFHNLIWSIAMSVVCIGPVGPVVGPQTHRLLTRISGWNAPPRQSPGVWASYRPASPVRCGKSTKNARAERAERWFVDGKVIAMAHELKSQLEYTQKDGTMNSLPLFSWEISLFGIFLGCVEKCHLVMKDDWNYQAVSSNSWNHGKDD